MFIYKLLPAALAAASALPSAMAAQCTAKGSIEGAGFGLTKSITITTGDSTFQYSAGDTGDNICGRVLMQTSKPSNLKRTKGNGNLASPVVWYGDCNGDGWSACHLDYQNQKNVAGTRGEKNEETYHSCTVTFNC